MPEIPLPGSLQSYTVAAAALLLEGSLFTTHTTHLNKTNRNRISFRYAGRSV